jgi:hypothetical protein
MVTGAYWASRAKLTIVRQATPSCRVIEPDRKQKEHLDTAENSQTGA